MEEFPIRTERLEDEPERQLSPDDVAPPKGKGKGRGDRRGKRQGKGTSATTIRDIEVSDRHFWKHDVTQQLSQKVMDVRGQGKQRKLHGNEITALGLNEIAAIRGRGYFFHMLTREAWTSWPGEELHPKSRVPPGPGSRFPALLYMKYAWSDQSREAFLSETHRGRYLNSDIMINPPQPEAPLYAMQYVFTNNQFIYTTPVESLVLLATDNSFYLARTTDLERIGGMWPTGKRPPRGPEPHKRLNTVGYVWDRTKDPVKADAMEPYKVRDLEELYERIVNCCDPLNLPSTFAASEVAQLVPRPRAPEPGLPFGMADEGHFKSAYPPSRRVIMVFFLLLFLFLFFFTDLKGSPPQPHERDDREKQPHPEYISDSEPDDCEDHRGAYHDAEENTIPDSTPTIDYNDPCASDDLYVPQSSAEDCGDLYLLNSERDHCDEDNDLYKSSRGLLESNDEAGGESDEEVQLNLGQPSSYMLDIPSLDLPSGMVSLLLKHNASLSRHPNFYQLPACFHFTSLRQHLADLSAYDDPRIQVPKRVELVPIEVLVALCLNEYAIKTDSPGRVRHSWAQPNYASSACERTLFFALRRWSKEERNSWEAWKPSHRLAVSSVFHPFHWSSPTTSVVSIRVIRHADTRTARRETDDTYIQRFQINVPGTSLQEVKQQDRKILFLIYFRSHLLAVSWKELFSLPIVNDPRDLQVPKGGTSNDLRAPAIGVYRNNRLRPENGMLPVVLLLQPTTDACKDWLQSHTLSDSMLEAAIFDRCRSEILDDSSGSLAMPWTEAFEALMSVEDQPLDTEADKKTNSEMPTEKKTRAEANLGAVENAKNRTGTQNKRWTSQEESTCQQVLNDISSAGVDDQAALYQASERLSAHGIKRTKMALEGRFCKSHGSWTSINQCRGTPTQRRWTPAEDDALVAVLNKLDGSQITRREQFSKAAEELCNTYNMDRTPTQIATRWSGSALLRERVHTTEARTKTAPDGLSQEYRPDDLSPLPVDEEMLQLQLQHVMLQKQEIELKLKMRELTRQRRETHASRGASSSNLVGLYTPPISHQESHPIADNDTSTPLVARNLPIPLSSRPGSHHGETTTSLSGSLASGGTSLFNFTRPYTPLTPHKKMQSTLNDSEVPRSVSKDAFLDTLHAGSFARQGTISSLPVSRLLFQSEPSLDSNTLDEVRSGLAPKVMQALWTCDEDKACITLMSGLKDKPIEKACEEVAQRLLKDYGFSRSPVSVQNRWYKIRPDSFKDTKHLRAHEWKPQEHEALEKILIQVKGLPLLEQALVISQRMKSDFGLDRSAHAVRHQLEQRSIRARSSSHHTTMNFESSNTQERSVEKGKQKARDQSVTIMADQAAASDLVEDLNQMSSDQETAEDDKCVGEEKQKTGEKKKGHATWTRREEQLCVQIEAEVRRSPAFAKKGVNAVMEEVAKRLLPHGYERTGRGIRNHVDRVKQAARRDSNIEDNQSKPRWTPEKLQAMVSITTELSTVSNSVERFQMVAQRMQSEFGYNCTATQVRSKCYAERFWEFDQSSRKLHSSHEVLLFDVKGALTTLQEHCTSAAQSKHVAFYICLNTADASYVDVIPNYLQDPDDEPVVSLEGQTRHLSVNKDRASKLSLRAQGLNQTNAPFRMPISMLGEAVARVRDCALGQSIYTNPWTQVAFPKWKPQTTKSNRYFRPLESTANFTAYKAAMEIYRCLQAHQYDTGMRFDFVGLQPRLADFKLLLHAQDSSSTTIPRLRQVFVQHKLHTTLLSSHNKFDRVTVVARRNAKNPGWYFTAINRFDYFFFQFTVSNDLNLGQRTEFFFLPERIIPDSFYVSSSTELSFDRPEFLDHKIVMDDDGGWVFRILEILQQEIQPRKLGNRPLRPAEPVAGIDFELAMNPELASEEQEEKRHIDIQEDPVCAEEEQNTQTDDSTSGRLFFSVAMRRCHTDFFEEVMQQCAKRLSGLLIVLSNNHPAGDFAFCRYRWTSAERDAYLQHGRVPRAAHHLPAIIPTVIICLYARHAGCSFEGPDLKPSMFRRLDACSLPRIIAWNLYGPDSRRTVPPVMIPSEDMGPTERQRQAFETEAKKETGTHTGYTPTLSALSNAGKFAGEYGVAACGPLVYEGNMWGEIWQTLDAFTSIDEVRLPLQTSRQPETYRHPLGALHQLLAEEHYHLATAVIRESKLVPGL
ncbi:hypothetical protein KCU71_g2701, partial [Aureobasidium melanogenum]